MSALQPGSDKQLTCLLGYNQMVVSGLDSAIEEHPALLIITLETLHQLPLTDALQVRCSVARNGA